MRLYCRVHYRDRASFRCQGCGEPFCQLCLIKVGDLSYCKNCGEEEMRMMALRAIVDTACFFLQSGRLNLDRANAFIEEVKDEVLELFPGKEDAFELIYRPRLTRLRDQFVRQP